jgi:hypothetical protein
MILKAQIPMDQGHLKVEEFNAQTKRMAALKTEPDGGPDPVDTFNAETKRMSAIGKIRADEEGAKKNRAEAILSSIKAVHEITKPPEKPPMKPSNGGSR